MAESWIDFAGLQKQLDDKGTAIVANQNAGVVSRKEVTRQTKAFRKLPNDADKLEQIKPLLKLYQTEIDALTSRCKNVEQSFMDVYKVLADAPDPKHLLAAKDEELASQAARVAALEDELASAKLANDELTNETPDKGNQEQHGDEDVSREMALQLERALLRAAEAESRTVSLRKELHKAGIADTGPNEASDAELDAAKRLQERDEELAAVRSQLALEHSAHEATKNQLKRATEAEATATAAAVAAAKQQQDVPKDTQVSQSDSDSSIVLRRDLQAAQASLQSLQDQVVQFEHRDETQRSLIAQLEEDLANVHQGDTFSTVSGWTAVPRRATSPSASLAAPSIRGGGPGPATIGGGPGERDPMAGIIVQQRDRFKKRSQELEEQQYKSKAMLESLQKDLQTLKHENSGLRERVRHLQSGPAPGVSTATKRPVNKAYEDLYRSLDAEKAMDEMNKVDRAICGVLSKGMLDTRVRYGLAGYILLLHLAAIL